MAEFIAFLKHAFSFKEVKVTGAATLVLVVANIICPKFLPDTKMSTTIKFIMAVLAILTTYIWSAYMARVRQIELEEEEKKGKK